MNRRMIIVLAALAAGVLLIRRRSESNNRPGELTTNGSKTSVSTNDGQNERMIQSTANAATNSLKMLDAYPLWHGGRAMTLDDPRWKIRREREERDPAWQGKMAIEFYGKVVDENDKPVADAKVELGWTDLSPTGSTRREIKSDASGRFSIKGIKGKRLVVMVSKDGYTPSHVLNRYGYEYASFGDEQYYEPNPTTPALFHLRRNGEIEPMVYREQEIKVSVGSPLVLTIDQETELRFLLESNNRDLASGAWRAQVSIQGGGIVPATVEFITKAPIEGFQSTLTLDSKTPKPPTWQMYQGGAFYLKAGQKFGRLDIEMVQGNDWFRLKLWLNPKIGSRNIEFDPNKALSPE